MTPEEYARIRALFDQAMELPTGARRGFVDSTTTTEDPLRPALLAMIEAGGDGDFLANALSARYRWPGAAARRSATTRSCRELGRAVWALCSSRLRNDDVFHKVVALKVIGERGRHSGRASFSGSSRSARFSRVSTIRTSRGSSTAATPRRPAVLCDGVRRRVSNRRLLQPDEAGCADPVRMMAQVCRQWSTCTRTRSRTGTSSPTTFW